LVAAARNALGEDVHALAAGAGQACIAEQREVSLELALDIGDPQRVCEAIGRVHGRELDLPRAIEGWLELNRGSVRSPAHRCAIAEQYLRWGEAERALEWARVDDGPDSGYARGRALLRLGRGAEVTQLFDQPRTESGSEPRSHRELGLRWRALVDAGRARLAWGEAQSWLEDGAPAGPGVESAVAYLWAGFAAMQVGDERARICFERALAMLEGTRGRESHGLRARAHQLQANLAEAGDDQLTALVQYRLAADAFEAAGEVVGHRLVEASSSALAYQAGEVGKSLERGRRALRGLVALGHVDLLPAVLFNLVQPLCLVDCVEEAAATRDLTVDLCAAAGATSPLALARLERVDAEIGAALAARAPTGGRERVEEAMAAAARRLEALGVGREACDAWLQAAVWARRGGARDRAGDHLEHARACVGEDLEAVDMELRVGLALELLAQAPSATALGDATRALARLPGPPTLGAAGKRMLAWSYDRKLLAAVQRQYPLGHAICRTVANRQLRTLETIMSKVHSLDRDAARSSLLTEAGDPEPLRALVRTLEQDAANLDKGDNGDHGDHSETTGAGPRPSHGSERGRSDAREHDSERLLLLFRRLGREDELGRLLEQLVEAMMELTNAERGVVVIGSGDAQLEVAREFSNAGDGVRYSRSILDSVRRQAEPIISVDAAADDRFDQSRSISHLNLRSVLAVPLVFRGDVLGAAYVDHRLRRGAFDESDLALMEDFCGLAALAVAHTQAMTELRTQANTLESQQKELARLLESREAEVQGLREAVRSQAPERRSYRGMIGGSAAMQRIFKLVDRLAGSDVPVVIHGESGTGKELVARAIHEAGPRARRPFVAENCGAIPETLLESVLFGHARGAFTGANVAKPGLFEAANGGTIFLDEVGEMSPAMQTKLLRVLQEGEIRRVGENQSRSIDVRVIAASNRDLEAMVEDGTFRSDLYYRINVVRVELPALRERRDDIAPLVVHFLERHGGGALDVTAAAMRMLTRYPWPGNVRELENETLRWVALVEGQVRPEDLAGPIQGLDGEVDDPDDLSLRPRVDRLERELIAKALQRTGGNQTQAAALLGLSRYGLQKKLRRLNDSEGAPT
jgi:transcriptional regulator with GAF, ATPase, and Fis domain